MNPRYYLLLPLALAVSATAFTQDDTLAIRPEVTSILINWSWQTENGDTTIRDFCILEFALPAGALDSAYAFRLESLKVTDDKGRSYPTNAFPVSAGEQSLHRDYRLLTREEGQAIAPRLRVRVENPQKDIDYFTVAGRLDVIFLSRDPNSVLEYRTMDWQSLYEALLPEGIQLVFAAQSRNMMEQMANLGAMTPEGQERLNEFMETYSMYLPETLFPENTSLLMDDPDKKVLTVETLGQEGNPMPHKQRRSYARGVLHLQQQHEAPLNGRERVRVVLATEGNLVSIPVRMEQVELPW